MQSPRERILAAARALFYARGIRAVGVDEIAESGLTNKMTLYRHFGSKDGLVTEYLSVLARESEAIWDELAQIHAGKPDAQIEGWIVRINEKLMEKGGRGCPIANAAVEIPEAEHPARAVIVGHMEAQRDRIAGLSRSAGFADPERLADEIHLLLEGARVNLQCVGRRGPGSRFRHRALAIVRGAPRNKS
ncbi:MAG: helix-turn-helix domain-containing protein [Rhizomicrobium sp.]|jgi:AcrR family transcriptional regulator